MENQNEFEKLEDALTHAGRSIAYPKTPAVAAKVRDSVGTKPAQRNIWSAPQHVRLIAVLVLVVGLVFFAFPESRDAFAQFIGLGNTRLTSTWTPTLAVTSTPSPLAPLTTMLPTRAGTPSTQYHNPGTIQQIQPPRSIPQPSHP
jgi:hypothetical protein